MNKRFVLFAGTRYYPNGGWSDFHSDSDVLDELVEAGKGLVRKDSDAWWHVVDLQEWRCPEGSYLYTVKGELRKA